MKNEGKNHLIQRLSSQLASQRPDYYAQLNQPLSMANIKALETTYNVLLPDDLKEQVECI